MNPEQQPVEETTQNAQWSYTSGQLMGEGEQNIPEATANNDEILISWTASEFVEHDKNSSWYLALAGVAVLISIIVYLFTRQIVSIVLVLIMAVVFGVYGSAKPRVLNYSISARGLTVGNTTHTFDTIKSFSVINEGGMPYIQVLFQKRLSIPVTIYAAPDEIDTIAEAIGQFVPYDQKKRDIADKLSSRIRF